MIHQLVTSWYENIKLSTHDSPTCDIMVQENIKLSTHDSPICDIMVQEYKTQYA